MYQSSFKRTTIYSVIFSVISMMVIIIFAVNKKIEITEMAQDEVVNLDAETSGPINDVQEAPKNERLTSFENSVTKEESGEKSLLFDSEGQKSEYLEIPLAIDVASQDISIENHYMDSLLCIVIRTKDKEFYLNNKVTGNVEHIKDGVFESNGNETVLSFETDGVYEYKSILAQNTLYVSFLNPHEVYDRIIVIDPACGGTDLGVTEGSLREKDINLNIAKALKKMMDSQDVKVYYTRIDDINPREEDRINLANTIRADMYIRIATGYEEDKNIYGVSSIYNDEFFIPGFGNVELADALEYEVVSTIKGKALGLVEYDKESYVLKNSIVPSAIIKIGCLSNPQEAILLGREDYIEKIATGIYNGILKAYEKKPD